MNTSSAWLSVHVWIYSSYDKAIEEMMRQQKEVCEWNRIDYDSVDNLDGEHEWDEYTEETEWTAIWNYHNSEDDYYINIQPLPTQDQEPICIV